MGGGCEAEEFLRILNDEVSTNSDERLFHDLTICWRAQETNSYYIQCFFSGLGSQDIVYHISYIGTSGIRNADFPNNPKNRVRVGF